MADPYSNVRDFARATFAEARAAARGEEPVTGAEVARRLRVCGSCPHLSEMGVCGACGCIMAIKARYRTAACPQGRWGNDGVMAGQWVDVR